jgi:hypothetical protein
MKGDLKAQSRNATIATDAWLVGSYAEQRKGDDMKIGGYFIKSDNIPILCDVACKDATVKSFGASEEFTIEPVEYIFMDGGGMVSSTEARIYWNANGSRFGSFVRQLPFAISHFQGKHEPTTKPPGCWIFDGFMRRYILSVDTIQPCIDEMKSLLKGTESLRQEAEMEMQQVVNGANKGGMRVLSERKCGCMSGKKYTECCGKALGLSQNK